ncbi:MAG TPA: DDE-type integrase/transposase/recombinase [Bryobacteraceae bacterium]|nr:DDE-type integrase/transposase/recombinase [Bryobacteraceae bacterium]
MNRLDTAKRSAIVRCLVEGCSIRSTVRMTGASKNTVAKLLVELGTACTRFMDDTMRNLPCERIQVDEIWQFVGAKQKNVKPHHFDDGGYAGDVWTWTAIDADTKLVPCWMLGQRDLAAARDFMEDLASRLANRVQLTSDGHKPYLKAVDAAFGNDIDFAQLQKIYGEIDSEGHRRYSPATCIGCETKIVSGDPDPKHISTSYVERQNLSMRMSMRRFTRLTNAFSKKLENHAAVIAIYFTWYNLGRVHQTLKKTPAMAAGISDHAWSVEEMIGLLEAVEPKSTRPARKAVSN